VPPADRLPVRGPAEVVHGRHQRRHDEHADAMIQGRCHDCLVKSAARPKNVRANLLPGIGAMADDGGLLSGGPPRSKGADRSVASRRPLGRGINSASHEDP
jgi:hypothetical protein